MSNCHSCSWKQRTGAGALYSLLDTMGVPATALPIRPHDTIRVIPKLLVFIVDWFIWFMFRTDTPLRDVFGVESARESPITRRLDGSFFGKARVNSLLFSRFRRRHRGRFRAFAAKIRSALEIS